MALNGPGAYGRVTSPRSPGLASARFVLGPRSPGQRGQPAHFTFEVKTPAGGDVHHTRAKSPRSPGARPKSPRSPANQFSFEVKSPASPSDHYGHAKSPRSPAGCPRSLKSPGGRARSPRSPVNQFSFEVKSSVSPDDHYGPGIKSPRSPKSPVGHPRTPRGSNNQFSFDVKSRVSPEDHYGPGIKSPRSPKSPVGRPRSPRGSTNQFSFEVKSPVSPEDHYGHIKSPRSRPNSPRSSAKEFSFEVKSPASPEEPYVPGVTSPRSPGGRPRLPKSQGGAGDVRHRRASVGSAREGSTTSGSSWSRCRRSTSDLTELTEEECSTVVTSLSRPSSPRRRGSVKGGAAGGLALLASRRGSRESQASQVSNEDVGPLNFTAGARLRQRRTSNFLELPERSCRDRWKNKRTALCRSFKPPPSESGKTKKPYNLAAHLAFLCPYMKGTNTVTSQEDNNVGGLESLHESQIASDAQHSTGVSATEEPLDMPGEGDCDAESEMAEQPHESKKRKMTTTHADKAFTEWLGSKKEREAKKQEDEDQRDDAEWLFLFF